jgi:hypothetical protein
MAAITAPTLTRLTDGTGDMLFTLAATACATDAVIPIVVPGVGLLRVVWLHMLAAGGTVATLAPEWHSSATPTTATRIRSETATTGLVFAETSATPDGSPVPLAFASGEGTAYLRPQPSAGDGTVAMSMRVRGS